MSLEDVLSAINTFVWGPPLLILLAGTGLYLTLRLGFIQITQLPRALRYLFKRDSGLQQKGDVSSFAALCTALAAVASGMNVDDFVIVTRRDNRSARTVAEKYARSAVAPIDYRA